MAQVTKTTNPLHFEDLEPHRFEDLVRQLAYEFKQWRKLEATGRAGSDDGFDARGWEIVRLDGDIAEPESEGQEDELRAPITTDRLWLIQCKREKGIGPKKLIDYLEAIPATERASLYGIVFACASDFSKKARDGFNQKCREFGVSECYLWGKAELEDMLFQPKNDGLLFAYFGISLTIRRRSVRAELRAHLAMKRKAIRLLRDKQSCNLLLRDPEAKEYPYSEQVSDFKKNPKWIVRNFSGIAHDGLKFTLKRFYAYLDDNGEKWDAAFALDTAFLSLQEDIWNGRDLDDHKLRSEIDKVWTSLDRNRAWFELIGVVHFSNILDIDEHGDSYVDQPHIYTMFSDSGIYDRVYAKIKAIGFDGRKTYTGPEEEERIVKFKSHLRDGPDRPKARK
jgi:hypothetical protein